MKKGLKITAIAVVVLLLLMFILPFAFRGKIESIVKSEGNKMLNAQFDFRSLDISLFRDFPKASITLSEFYLRGTGEFEKDTLVQAGEIIAAIDLFSLFGDKGYDVSKIQIDNTDIHAIVLPDGHTNWDIMKPDSTPNNTETENKNETSPFKIQLQRFVIKNMNITYDDRQAGMYADIRNLDVFCSGDLGSDRTTLQLEAESKATTYKMNGIPFLSNADIFAKMNVDADLVNNKYTLKENEFRLNAIKAAIDGWVALNNPSIEMDLKLNSNEVGFKEILSLVPAIYAKDFDGLKTEGTASLTANAKGSLQGDSIVPQFNMTMAVKNAMFHYPSLPAGVDQINILAEIKNPGGNIDLTTIRINPFNFRLAGNPFKLVADIRTPVTDPDFQAEAKGILNLSKIKEVYPLEDMQLNGTINADMQLSARLSYIEKEQYERVQASGTIGLTDMQLKIKDMPDVDIHKSLFTFTPKYLQLTETTINIGKNDLTVDSRFENYLGYILKGSTIKGTVNLQSNHLNLNDFITATSSNANETSKTGNSSIVETSPVDTATVSLIHVPDNIDFQMDANLKEVLFDKMSFTDMNGKLIVKDSKVDMKNLSMNTMGGGVVMNGYYSTANVNIPKMDTGFRLNDINFAQAYKDLDMVQQFAPIFENLKGNFSGNMNIQTDLDATMSPVLSTMQGNGNLSTKDLSLSGVKVIDQIADAVKKPELKEMKVKDMTLDFTIKDGRVATQPFDIKLGEYAMNLSGTTGLDQTIDYTGKIKLPASAGDFAKLTTLDLKIGGSFTSPKVSIDTKSMANQAVEAIADKAAGELGKKLGLDSTITTNKDSLKEKIKEKATEKALDFLKKKLH